MLLYLWMIVQILCESLPISSSGHVLLLQQIMMKYQISQDNIPYDLWAFDYILQGLSAIVIFCYFFPMWWQLIVRKPMEISSLLQRDIWVKTVPAVFLFGLIADGITFLAWNFINFDNLYFSVACGFFMTASALWSLQYTIEKNNIATWSCKYAIVVGSAQAISLLPGISRFGTTFVSLQWCGYQGRVAFALSFLLQWPLIVAGALKGFYALQDQLIMQTMVSLPFLMTVVIAGYGAYKLLFWVGTIIDKKMLWKFSYYMMIPTFIALWI